MAEHVVAAGAGDLLGHPVAAGKGRVEPLEGEDAGAGRGKGGGRGQALAKPRGDAGALGRTAGGLADFLHGARDAFEVEGREGEDAGAELLFVDDAVDLPLADRADIAEGLRDDEVGLEFAQAGNVDGVRGSAGGEEGADGGVDLGLGEAAGLHGGGGEDGEAAGAGGVVALVRDADDLVASAHGEDDLGGAGEEGGDAHVCGAAWPAARACASRDRGGRAPLGWGRRRTAAGAGHARATASGDQRDGGVGPAASLGHAHVRAGGLRESWRARRSTTRAWS